MAEYSLAELSRSGIYQIRNKVNGKRYVGSALRLGKRWAEHRRDLAAGRHHSVSLQRAWDKYGAEAFSFLVLEYCDKELLIEREQFHLDQIGDYNICRVAGSSLGIKHRPEVVQKMREAQARIRARPGWVSPTKGVKYSREICERMAAPKRGRKQPARSAEWCLKISQAKTGKSTGKGREVSEVTRQKIRESLLGRKIPIEDRKRDSRLTLKDEQVLEVIRLRISGESYSKISDSTGIGWHLIQRICSRKRYEWVAPELVIPTFKSAGWKVHGRKRGVTRSRENEQSPDGTSAQSA